MGKKILITQRQLGLITESINETEANVRLKNSIYNFLNKDYEPSSGVKKMANEFHDTALIKKKLDGEDITPNALCDYLEHKFVGLSKAEINDSLMGWYYGDFDVETGMRKRK
jgi:hypothetical protein